MYVRMVTTAMCFFDFRKGTRISLKTIVPPSPFFSRLVASHAYSIVTSVVSVQNISDRTPIMLASVAVVKRNMTVNVYNGLVPMSPKTSPADFIIFLAPFRETILIRFSSLKS